MDELHTVRENCQKVEALVNAVEMMYDNRKHMPAGSWEYEIENLNQLAREARESLEAIRYKAL